MSQKTNLWWNKSRRAQTSEDYETWIQGGVVPTLNAFDNGDVRTTTIIFENRYDEGIRIKNSEIFSTIRSAYGTGGGNVPMVAQVIGIQNTVIGRSDTAGPQGKGHTEEGEPMFTIDTTSPHAVVENSIVRRLTPLECERLQGFPDGWTEGQSDTHRYKQMGNAVAVPVVEWIVQGICDTFDTAS